MLRTHRRKKEKKMKISLIIPMYNEISIVCEAVETFSHYMAENFEDWELILWTTVLPTAAERLLPKNIFPKT